MRLILAIIFFLYVYIEISLFVAVANLIGVFLALVCLLATSVLGLSLVKSQGLRNLASLQQKMARNQNPSKEVSKSISIMIAGFLLLIPGFLTDIIGAILLLPPVQSLFAKIILPKFTVVQYGAHSRQSSNDDNIIDGEFKRKDDE